MGVKRKISETAAPVTIDGSMLEGGGQILRNAASLSAITGNPITIEKIRAGRDKPGLRPQHLTGMQLIEQLSGGTLEGGALGSSCVSLTPSRLVCRDAVGYTGTAGSCTLLAQAALPCLLMACPGEGGRTQSHVELRGGTDAPMAPPASYLQHVLLPTLRRALGITADAQLERRGFYPKGGGRVCLTADALPAGSTLPPMDLTQRGTVREFSVHAFTAGSLPPSAAQEMITAVEIVLAKAGYGDIPVHSQGVRESLESAVGNGAGCLIRAVTSEGHILGAAAVPQRGTRAADMAEEAAEQLVEDLADGGCLDRWLQDQIIIFMALARGESQVTCGEPSLHTRTAMMVGEALTRAHFRLLPPQPPSRTWTITCQGAAVPAGGVSPDNPCT